MSQLTNVGELLATLVLIGFLTETVVELLKNYVVKTKHSAVFIYTISIVVGLVLAFALRVSLFEPSQPFAYYVGMVICGLVASRGSNYVHNWLGNLPTRKKQ